MRVVTIFIDDLSWYKEQFNTLKVFEICNCFLLLFVAFCKRPFMLVFLLIVLRPPLVEMLLLSFSSAYVSTWRVYFYIQMRL